MSQKNFSENAEFIPKRILDSIGKADFFYVLAQVPDLCMPFIDLSKALWKSFDARSREMLILRIAIRFNSSYELQHHLTIARNSGLNTEEIESIITCGYLEKFKKSDNILLHTVDQIINKKEIDKSSFFEYYNKNQLQYIVGFVGFYSWLDYYTTALDLKIGQREW